MPKLRWRLCASRLAANDSKAREEIAAIRTILTETAVVQREQARILIRLEKGLGRVENAVVSLDESHKVSEQKLQGLIERLASRPQRTSQAARRIILFDPSPPPQPEAIPGPHGGHPDDRRGIARNHVAGMMHPEINA